MKRKTNAILNIVLIAGILLILMICSLVKKDRKFSEHENRLLAQKPAFTVDTLFSGKFSKDFEVYVTDQFVSRDEWIAVKTYVDILLGKKDIKGVYLGKDGYFIEMHLPESVKAETEEKRLSLLAALSDYCEGRGGSGTFRVLLSPTADNVLKDKLPAYASVYNQSAFLEQVRERIPKEAYVDAEKILNEHREESIYYRTDHHWTTLGAYYAYTEWAKSMGILPLSQEEFEIRTVTDSFLGTLHSKMNIRAKADEIKVYLPKQDTQYQVYYDLSQTAKDSLYEEKYLDTKNKYGMFLDDNHGIVEIDTNVKNGKTLFVIKDSYANCFIPFAAMHYEKVIVADLRYYNGKLYNLIEKDVDVLVLYNVYHFIDEFQYYE